MDLGNVRIVRFFGPGLIPKEISMKIRFRLFFSLVVLVSLSVSLFAQATDSVIVGTVNDATGAAVPNANVVATNRDTNVQYTTVTNGTGEYRLNNVPVGTYSISTSAAGFATATVSGVQLELNRTASVNLNLSVGSVST